MWVSVGLQAKKHEKKARCACFGGVEKRVWFVAAAGLGSIGRQRQGLRFAPCDLEGKHAAQAIAQQLGSSRRIIKGAANYAGGRGCGERLLTQRQWRWIVGCGGQAAAR